MHSMLKSTLIKRSVYCLFVAILPLYFQACASSLPEAIHRDVLTLDTHIDIPGNYTHGDADPGKDSFMQVDLKKMREGGLDSGFFIVYVPQGALDEEGFHSAYTRAKQKFAGIERQSQQNPEQITLVKSAQALEKVHRQGRLAAAIGVENAYPLGANLEHLDEFYQLGARYISLTHFGNNHLADSSVPKGTLNGSEEPKHQGLSELGKEAVHQFNRMGIMVDVSHSSKASTLQATALSKAPVIASHSAIEGVYKHPRNLSDEELKAIAANGGVIQIVAYDHYLKARPKEKVNEINTIKKQFQLNTSADWAKASQKTRYDFRQRMNALNTQWPAASLDDFLDHLDYAVKLVGVDHVGISSDFGGGGGIIGWGSADESINVTRALVARGYDLEDIRKLWGGNLLRVWKRVETIAEQLSLEG